MTAEHPNKSCQPAVDDADSTEGTVIPFPQATRNPNKHRTERWKLAVDVRGVGGAEGEWLRRELAAVVRELLLWAREDLSSSELSDDHEERAA
jgi:hypothetical protein